MKIIKDIAFSTPTYRVVSVLDARSKARYSVGVTLGDRIRFEHRTLPRWSTKVPKYEMFHNEVRKCELTATDIEIFQEMYVLGEEAPTEE